DQGVADQAFWNHSTQLLWELIFDDAGYIGPGEELIQPYNVQNFTGWSDIMAGLNFSNYTRDVIIDSSIIEALYVTAPEVILSAEVKQNSTAFTGSTYALDLPSTFLDQDSAYVNNLTQAVLNQSGALSAWEKVAAIQEFLTNVNDTITFLRNHDGSKRVDGLGTDSDISHWLLNSSHEGSCDEFASVFAVMVRLAGIPARKVTGFSGGTWNGESFMVYGKDFSRWVEVHLQTNQNQGELDLGWIPFEACPPMSLVEVVNETWGPSAIERDISKSETIWVEGTLRFADNSTSAENVTLFMYLVEPDDADDVPGRPAVDGHIVANTTTDENGSFNLTGLPSEVIRPGYGSLVIQTLEQGYVGTQGVTFPWLINVTDEVILSLSEPPPIEEPMLGIGVNTTVLGQLSWSSNPSLDPSLVDDLQVVLNYVTVSDGEVNLTSSVSGGGYYEFSVPIAESEPLGLINASISFLGWHEDDLNNATPPSYHAQPSAISLMFNITLSPNLSVTLEAQGSNNTILEIDNSIFLNGTVLSRGENPSTLNGTLILEMRRLDIAGPYTTLSTWYLNDTSWAPPSSGDFAINWSFSAAEVPLPAGPVEVRIQFDAEGLFANDQIQFSEYGIRSFVEFNYTLSPKPRGIQAEVEVILTDHTGNSFASFEGAYNLDFDGIDAWNETDPSSPRLVVAWSPAWNMEPGDYDWFLNYSGSTWLQPASSQETIRIRGLANASASINLDWTPRGGTNWVTGFAGDMALNSVVTGNNSSVTMQLEVPSSLPPTPFGPPPPDIYILATGWLNTTTGGYNLPFEMPSGVASGVYTIRIKLDFSVSPPSGGHYYGVSDGTAILAGIQSEFVVTTEPKAVILVAGDSLVVNATVTDVEDASKSIGDVGLDLYFDWGGPLQQVLDSATTDSEGVAVFSPIIPSSVAPGFYDIRIHAPDDLSDNISAENAGRWIGNHSMVNLTVQVPSFVEISSIPNEVTALQYFTIAGTVIDSVDSNRTIQGPVGLEVFFLDQADEILIENHTTDSNGSFNVSVPTDTLGDGVTRGTRTVVVSVLNGTTPFYLTGTGDASILVRGIPQLVGTTPFLNTVINRGETATITSRLVEFSDNDEGLSGYSVLAKFHDTWLEQEITSGDGSIAFEFDIPHNHPLGVVNVTLFFNGSEDLHATIRTISTITVRSSANMAINPIIDNPLAGEFFNVTGSLVSSNGSALTDRSGNLLNPTLTFSIDGESDTFTVSQLTFEPDGNWNALLRLDLSFPRGSHG
ncbi:MAG: transglutaminase-like domain-containing protein, partial [Candidatus Thermoplasmatota archaeon]|nr:transglutaminase-like domain-containing protein [Candidatus Thermoplasmatota archaeon]